MSKLTEAYFEIARIIRWEAKNLVCLFTDLDYDIDGSVQYYHKADGYRVIKITADNKRFLQELSRIIRDRIEEKATRALVHFEIYGSMRNKSEHVLMVSIHRADKLDIITRNIS